MATAAIPAAQELPIDFLRQVQPIFQQRCYECHGPKKQQADLRLDVKAIALRGGASGPAIVAGSSQESRLIRLVSESSPDLRMPQRGEPPTSEQTATLRAWIDQGAPWPDRLDPQDYTEQRRHWAFKPPRRIEPPSPANPALVRNAIDHFIQAKLAGSGLTPAPGAEPATLIRRLSLDLLGLPPTPEEIRQFVADSSASADAYNKLVDRYLASERYGERWARHWLDVVRFAETTGFEVNTPRDNAWPYRDFVIDAFNRDLPYDQFILHQLAGDAFEQDAATGFLVAGPNDQVKSPDIVLTKNQRADELHDMVSTTASAFLGLTVGCARCHDHKFDPISQVEYYAMKAVFAGVQHGERRWRGPDEAEREAKVAAVRSRLQDVEARLTTFAPLARMEKTARPVPNPRLNEELFMAVEAKFVRFTIHQTALHETLGEIEPCLDELEIWTAEENSQNIALRESGAMASASGTYPNSELHKLEHVNDGRYGNSSSWISDQKNSGWVQIELPQTSSIDRIRWERDREEKYRDRLPLSYTISVSRDGERWETVVERPPLRPAVAARYNVDRFSPVAAKFLRFTIRETTGAEPCLDELEVYSTEPAPQNVALATNGARASASSTLLNSTLHRLEHVNDGTYGNSRSWISAEAGKGSVQIEFADIVSIDKVIWSRDRDEKYRDRLPTNYEIEVAVHSDKWRKVASSEDRRPYVQGQKFSAPYPTNQLAASQLARLTGLLEEQKKLEVKLKELEASRMVYAGVFTAPEIVYRLHRGDPMQDREIVNPGALTSICFPDENDRKVNGSSAPTGTFPKLQLPAQTPEQKRRVELARWITDKNNPLTARVMVNRIWQYHFGEGLVSTSSDFGLNGARPSHLELLDWLATELMANRWRLKPIHRLMLLSHAYRQSGAAREEALSIDAGNRLLWRFGPRRLEAEAIRDAVLSVSGKLDLKMGGPGYQVFEANNNYVRVYDPKQEFGPNEWRRMIYQFKPRMQQDAVFGAFDCPDGGQIAPKRTSSTTPLQALNLLNSHFIFQQAKFFAERLTREAGSSKSAQTQRGFQLAFGRNAEAEELSAALGLIEMHGLAAFCRAMFNANEFIFIF